MSALRVLHIDTEKTWRGGEQQALYLALGLQARGVEQLCVGRPGRPYVERCADAGLDAEAVEMRGEGDVLGIARLARLFERWRPDIIHMHTSHAHTLGVLACKKSGIGRTVVSRRVDFTIYRNFLRLSWFKYRFGVDRYIAISEGIKRQMVTDGIPGERIDVVHSGIDVRRFEGSVVHDYKTEFGLPDDAVIIGDVAAFGWHKAQEFLVRAMPRILERVPSAYVFLIGDGDLRPRIEAEIRSLGLEDRILFTGFRTDVPSLIRGMDCFVMCSVLEGLCTSLLDALALGCPAVGSAVGGIPEVLVDDETGLTVPPRDPDALADAVVRVLTEPGLADRLRDAGRRHVNAGFTVDSMVEGNLGVYRRLVEAGR
jgi:glycosyltransferase involved in cell wall biosynthesis